jgi:hypothetical protein
MSIEDGNSERPFMDEVIEGAVSQHGEGERRLYEASPVGWLRGAVALDTGRGASEISDAELAERYTNGGFMEWDPRVAKVTRLMLKQRGLII